MSLLELLIVGLGCYCFGDIVGYRRGIREAMQKLSPGVEALKRSADQQLQIVRRRKTP